MLGKRQLVRGHRDRYAGADEGAAQHGEVAGGGPDEDRHLRPGHTMAQMRVTQVVCDERRLLTRRGQDVHSHLPRPITGRQQVAVLVATGPGDVADHSTRGGQQHLATAPAGGQRDCRRRSSVRRREPLREVEDAALGGTAEGVDRLVGIADDDEVPAAAGEQAEQLLLRRVAVLVLIDVHLGQPLLLRGQGPRIGVQ